jgi:hypothetical protein
MSNSTFIAGTTSQDLIIKTRLTQGQWSRAETRYQKGSINTLQPCDTQHMCTVGHQFLTLRTASTYSMTLCTASTYQMTLCTASTYQITTYSTRSKPEILSPHSQAQNSVLHGSHNGRTSFSSFSPSSLGFCHGSNPRYKLPLFCKQTLHPSSHTLQHCQCTASMSPFPRDITLNAINSQARLCGQAR